MRRRLDRVMPGTIGSQSTASQDSGSGTLRVLYVEDNAMNRQVVEDMLTMAGAHMVGAPDAIAGLKQVEANEFDVVLMDIRMPGMDGLSATEQIRKMSSPVSSIPIIVVTADTSPDLRERCEAAQANDVIMKPVALQQLLGSIGRAMANAPSANVMLD